MDKEKPEHHEEHIFDLHFPVYNKLLKRSNFWKLISKIKIRKLDEEPEKSISLEY